MQDSPSSAFRLLVTNTAIVTFRDAAVVLGVVVGDVGVATDAGGVLVGTNIPALVMITRNLIGTVHVVFADNLILSIGGVGWTVLWTLIVTRL